jgi:hypothetical protein
VFGMGTIKGGSRATKKAGHDVVHIYRESERARERERERERERTSSERSQLHSIQVHDKQASLWSVCKRCVGARIHVRAYYY